MTRQFSLDSFGPSQKKEKKEKISSTPEPSFNEPILERAPKKTKKSKEKSVVTYSDYPKNLTASYLVSVKYDGKKALANLKLYEPISKKIYFWDDNTGHKPYCLTSLPPKEVKKLSRVTSHSGYDHLETVEKFNPLLNKKMNLTKV